MARDTLLVSHANPEDNEFALWLTLQLANNGYKTWCDLTHLLGGEVFWDNIEDVIRQGASRVLYVLSKTSNSKDGPLRELQLAQSVARREKLTEFVIPLHIDDLPHGDITIELSRINSTPFHNNWASGLSMLLQRLEENNVPRTLGFSRTAVNEWWRTNFSAGRGVRQEPEEHLSNWFPIVSLPEHAYFHTLGRRGIGKIEISSELPYPAFQDDLSLISFAEADAFGDQLGESMYIAASNRFSVTALLNDREGAFGRHLFRLLRLTWEHFLRNRASPIHELANGIKSLYFIKDALPADKAFFVDRQGKERFRSMVGYSTRTNPTTRVATKRYWHFGLEARPQVYPRLAFVMKPHVVFSNDGTTIWTSKKKLAAARQSQCKGWWNDTWRDRTLAAMAYLSDEKESAEMPVSPDRTIQVSRLPILFESPVAYTDPQELDEDQIAAMVDDLTRRNDSEDDPLEEEESQ